MSQSGNLIFRVTDINAIYSNTYVCVCLSLSSFVDLLRLFIYLSLPISLSLSFSLCISFWLPSCLYLGKYFKLARAKVVDIQGEGGCQGSLALPRGRVGNKLSRRQLH